MHFCSGRYALGTRSRWVTSLPRTSPRRCSCPGACSDVEVLGWLYQFYIAERKDEYFASKRNVFCQ